MVTLIHSKACFIKNVTGHYKKTLRFRLYKHTEFGVDLSERSREPARRQHWGLLLIQRAEAAFTDATFELAGSAFWDNLDNHAPTPYIPYFF